VKRAHEQLCLLEPIEAANYARMLSELQWARALEISRRVEQKEVSA